MLRGPFLTDLDSRAAIKGSRDPLGVQPIWVRFGRHVVGNLTTVSSELRDFTVLLLGLWFVERVRESGGNEPDVSVFLKWEQLAGYARHLNGEGRSFRGIERVQRNLSESPKVTLSGDRSRQILSNQKVYGLWGLYRVSARNSGLAEDEPARLTPVARRFVDANYAPMFSRAGFHHADAVVKLLSREFVRIDTEGRERPLIEAVGKMLRLDRLTNTERTFYDQHLVDGGPQDDTAGRQSRLAALLERTVGRDDFTFSPEAVGRLAARAGASEGAESLGVRLHKIRACETLLAPAVALFFFVLTRDRASMDAVVSQVRDCWGERVRTIDAGDDVLAEIAESLGNDDAGRRWSEVARLLSCGSYADALDLLIAHNAAVMKDRGSSGAWVEVRQGRLHVFNRDEQARLPGKDELPSLWRSSYFLDSLRSMVAQVRGAAS